MSKSKDYRSALSQNFLTAFVIAVLAGAIPVPAWAQQSPQAQSAQQETGAMLWQKGGCFNCHGNLAAGDGDPTFPQAPNLRATKLTRDQLVETISCGRPGTLMPYHLATSYTTTACYGRPLGAAPSDVSPGAGFNADQIQKLVDFLEQNVVGKANITRDNCAAFFDGNANTPLCRQY
jgi:hypothetical protein